MLVAMFRRMSLLIIGVLCLNCTVAQRMAEPATAAIHDAAVTVSADVDGQSMRVVVQNPTLGRVLDERDGYSLVRSLPAPFRGRPHILELHDLSGPHLVQVIELQKPVEHAVLGPNARWCLVSYRGERGVIRIDLINDSQQILIENAGGLLSLDEKSKRLAVLGLVPSDEPADFSRELTLGVWDLNEEQWIASTRTPIWIMGAISHFLPPVWSDDRVIVEGPDRGISARRIMGYRWLTTLDTSTGEGETLQGPPNEGWDGKWMSPLCAARAAEVSEWHTRLKEAWSNRLLQRPRAFPATDVTMSMVELRDGTLVIAMQHDRAAVVTMSVSPDGDITIRHFDDSHRYREAPFAVADRLLIARRQHVDFREMFDFVQNEVVASLPLVRRKEGGLFPIQRYLPQGWIEGDLEEFRYYGSDDQEPRWTIALNEDLNARTLSVRNWIRRAVGSKDGRYIAMLRNPDDSTLQVRRSTDGHVVMTASVAPLADAVAFSYAGDILAIASGGTMRLHEISTGKRILEADLPMGYRILALEDGWWCLQDISALHVVNNHLEHQFTIPIRRTLSATWVGDDDDRALLLIGELGEITLVDPRTAEVRTKRHAPLPKGGPVRLDGPLQARVIFSGRVLAWNAGFAGTLELLRLPELEPIVRISIVPVDESEVGWAAWSPDGSWDASPGAEVSVRIVRGTQVLPKEKTKVQRDSLGIRRLISAAAENSD